MRQHEYIDTAGDPGVQRVKPDAAAAGHEYGVGKQVIKIDQHGEQEDQVNRFPPLREKPPGDQHRENEMQEVMKNKLNRRHSPKDTGLRNAGR